jgi:hypothetical protein
MPAFHITSVSSQRKPLRLDPAYLMPASCLHGDSLAREYERLANEVRVLSAENAELRRALNH